MHILHSVVMATPRIKDWGCSETTISDKVNINDFIILNLSIKYCRHYELQSRYMKAMANDK